MLLQTLRPCPVWQEPSDHCPSQHAGSDACRIGAFEPAPLIQLLLVLQLMLTQQWYCDHPQLENVRQNTCDAVDTQLKRAVSIERAWAT